MTSQWISRSAWFFIGVIVVGFFLPWAELDIGKSKIGKEIASSVRRSLVKSFNTDSVKEPSWIRARKKPPTIPTQVSGVQIPRLANQQNVKVATQFVKLLTKTDEHLGAKSYAVYLVPGIAVLCGILLSAFTDNRLLACGVAAVCAVIAFSGFWNLLATNTRVQFAVVIGPGLWLSLWAYLGLSAAAAAVALPPAMQERIVSLVLRALRIARIEPTVSDRSPQQAPLTP